MALWIILGILLLIFLLLQFSITLYLEWGEKTVVKAGIAGMKWSIVPHEEPKPKKKKTKKKPSPPKKEKPKEKPVTDWKEQLRQVVADGEDQSFGEFIAALMALVAEFLNPLGRILSAIRIEALRYEVLVGAEDAHKTAMLYTAVTAGFYQVIAVLQQKIIIRCKKVSFAPSFTAGKITHQGSMKIKLRLSVVLRHSMVLIWKAVRLKLRMNQAQSSTQES